MKVESIKLLIEKILQHGKVIKEIDDSDKNGYALQLFEYNDIWIIAEKIQFKKYLDVFSSKDEAEEVFDRIKIEYENG